MKGSWPLDDMSAAQIEKAIDVSGSSALPMGTTRQPMRRSAAAVARVGVAHVGVEAAAQRPRHERLFERVDR